MKSSKILRNLGFALALVSSVAIMSQQVRADGTTWTARSAAEANQWSSVTFGNGTFVAVSNSGTDRIMTSPDGITWTPRGSSTDSWDAIAYGNNTFVAVGMSTNRVMTSTDGITWTNRTVPTGIQQWKSVTWGNNKFVAVSGTGFNDRVMTSADGVTWTYAQAIHNGNWSSIAYGNNTFVATATSFGGGGSMDYVMTSSDGITWTARTAAAAVGWNAVVYGGGKFVAVTNSGSNRVMTSANYHHCCADHHYNGASTYRICSRSHRHRHQDLLTSTGTCRIIISNCCSYTGTEQNFRHHNSHTHSVSAQ